MKIKTLSLGFLIALAINVYTPCLTLHSENPTSQKVSGEYDCFLDQLKGAGAFLGTFFLSKIIESYFEYQDDKAISKIKENDDEYKNAKSWKEKAKISKAILTEYYKNFTLNKKWGRKCAKILPVLGGTYLLYFYFKRSFFSMLESTRY